MRTGERIRPYSKNDYIFVGIPHHRLLGEFNIDSYWFNITLRNVYKAQIEPHRFSHKAAGFGN
jgi:hypothetical protein